MTGTLLCVATGTRKYCVKPPDGIALHSPMTSEEIILNHPPAVEVRLEVTFPNNLAIADERSRFAKLVRDAFPLVAMPEQNKMTYDLGDHTLYSAENAERLEIGMSYFRVVTTRYDGFKKFRALFLKSLRLFSECYGLKRFNNLAMTYQNRLPLEREHTLFENLFKLEVKLPEELNSELFAGKGLLVFKKPEGFVSVQFDPETGTAGLNAYSMTLYFVTPAETTVGAEQLEASVDTAHQYLDKFFFGILTEPYMNYLRTK